MISNAEEIAWESKGSISSALLIPWESLVEMAASGIIPWEALRDARKFKIFGITRSFQDEAWVLDLIEVK